MADSPQAILRDEPRGYIVPRLLELLHSWMRRYFTPSIMSSQYAHQNYVHIDTASTKAEHRAAVEAATYATSILARSLNPQVRWAFRGCIAYKCHVQSDVYTRYTDDVDIIIDSKEYGYIDDIEDALMHADAQKFRKVLSPSRLLKVHYHSDDGHIVRFDIYNSTMHSTGAGVYHGFKIEHCVLIEESIAQSLTDQHLPVMSLLALVDMKLVAYLERRQAKDFEDIFFALWEKNLGVNAGLPWFQQNVSRHEDLVSGELMERAQQHRSLMRTDQISPCFDANLAIVRGVETRTANNVKH